MLELNGRGILLQFGVTAGVVLAVDALEMITRRRGR